MARFFCRHPADTGTEYSGTSTGQARFIERRFAFAIVACSLPPHAIPQRHHQSRVSANFKTPARRLRPSRFMEAQAYPWLPCRHSRQATDGKRSRTDMEASKAFATSMHASGAKDQTGNTI